MDKRRITIAGAGISGLTAAINLAKEGYEVAVFEKGKTVGTRFNNDFQGLENWSTREDILSILKRINIKSDFFYEAFREADLINDKLEKHTIKSGGGRAGTYIVKRGSDEDSLDKSLEKQAVNLGVQIEFGTRVEEREVDVVAMGPTFASGMVYGVKGEVEKGNQISIMLDNDCAPKGYVYMAIIEGRVTLASVVMQDLNHCKNYFEKALAKMERLYGVRLANPKFFSGFGNFRLLNSFSEGGRLYAGERAGFQDFLFGFGMRYAFLSGYLVAQSISKNLSYDSLIQDELIPSMKSSLVNRYVYEKLGNKGYRKLVKKWAAAEDPIKFLQQWYQFGRLKRVLYPLSYRWHKKRGMPFRI